MDKYYYIVFTVSRKADSSIKNVMDVRYGDIADIILKFQKTDAENQHYTDGVISFYSEITKEQYLKLKDNIG